MTNIKEKVLIGLFVFFLLLTNSCSIESSKEPIPYEETDINGGIIFTMENNKTTITIKPNELFIVQLEGNITTGYTWEVQELDEDFLQQQGEMEYRQLETSADSTAEEPLAGAPGEFSFSFKALKAGDTELRLIYHRTFEPDVAPLDEFSITVHIVD